MRDSLAKYQEDTPLSDEELYYKKRKAWLNGEGLHLNTEQIKKLPLEYQWNLDIIGKLVYGSKNDKHK